MEEEETPIVRHSSRKRKPKSFGEEFEEQFSPPKGTQDPTPQQPKATDQKPGPSKDPDVEQEGPPVPSAAEDTITWSSSEKYWKQLLPRNHRKRYYFSRQRLSNISKRL